jgi:hypothetical protein
MLLISVNSYKFDSIGMYDLKKALYFSAETCRCACKFNMEVSCYENGTTILLLVVSVE